MPICLPSFAGTTAPASGGGGGFTNQYSVSFDGTDDSIAISSTPTYITQSSAFSLSFWMNPSGYGSNGTYANVLALKSDFNSKNFAIHINNNTSGYAGISFGITDYNTNTAFYHSTGVTGNTLLNTWSHVVITYDGSGLGTIGNWKLYINGSSKTIGTGGGWFDSGTPINTIGNYRSYHYEGLIDELAVFNSELSSSNVTSIYNSGTPTDISSLSPVGWWRMGDNDGASGTTITDQGSGSNDATLTNGPTFSTDVPEYKFNRYSVSFDGTDDFIDVGAVSDLNGSISAVTISAWFNVSAFGDAVISGGSSGSDRFYMQIYDSTTIRYGSGVGFDDFIVPTLSTGTWYHIALVHNGTSAALYLNNSQSSSGSQVVESPTANYGSSLKIGSYFSGSNYFQGLLDEVAVFDSALSASNITSIYNSGVPNDISSLSPVGWWRMGDGTEAGSGTTIYDMSSNSNNGTLTNGPTFSTTVPT